jgi:hypothetical protein
MPEASLHYDFKRALSQSCWTEFAADMWDAQAGELMPLFREIRIAARGSAYRKGSCDVNSKMFRLSCA